MKINSPNLLLSIALLSLFNVFTHSAAAQTQKPGQVKLSPKQTKQVGPSRIQDSYQANDYILYNKEGTLTGERGSLHAASTDITLRTYASNIKIGFNIGLNTTISSTTDSAFSIFKGPNSDPTFLGYGLGWNRFIAKGSLAFFSNNTGLSNASIPNLFISTVGKVGIGTNTPAYNFQVTGLSETFGIVQNYGSVNVGFKTGNDYGGVGTASNSTLKLFANNQAVGTFLTNGNFGIGTTNPSQKLQVEGNTYLNGNVGIGTSSPAQKLQVEGNTLLNGDVGVANDLSGISQDNLNKYSLFVNKGILSEDYSLGPRSSWADFVFNKNYDLANLNQVARYIQVNHHLPGIPTAQQVKQDGYNLHDMNVKLLQKIEELTLYSIGQQKEIDELKKQIELYKQLSEKVNVLQKLISSKQ